MKKNIFISMEREIFRGNILDIGMENQGIFYNIYKKYNDDINVEYISGKEGKKNIHENFYDSCILFFSLNSIWLKNRKRDLIKDIYKYLNKDGIIYIWDIDKGYGKIFNGHIKIVIPGSKIKHMDIKELNILKDISKENTITLLENYFDILDSKSSDGIYYIKARKKLMLSNVNNGVLKKEKETKEKIGAN
ncbi:class I SAM-dependent methyltransferase [Clostridiaceae bacterium UIB06]|uniref:Class I SAM-dependent methyltransferase n=1 Tax=Clostridium thailandense TaxID=2794346 RepID=A0A949WQV7_9CLOT|nr:class I SAM-dependent methyltransferase [Clostridium thailandense]MBV7273245.1 class I SAM-dependent methyltransferase [Clostridium thailandense]MCH5137958.1 class I SAM-dependent methyltransferase [Clostridiaceae bacterium UIB06]